MERDLCSRHHRLCILNTTFCSGDDSNTQKVNSQIHLCAQSCSFPWWCHMGKQEEQKPHVLHGSCSPSAEDPTRFTSRCSCMLFAHYEPKGNAQQEPAVTELDPSMEEQVGALLKMWNCKTLRGIIGQKAGPGPTWLSKVNQYAIKERKQEGKKKFALQNMVCTMAWNWIAFFF